MAIMIDAKVVYNWFRKIIEKSSRVVYDSNIIHISEVSGCLRKAYFERKTLKPALDVKNVVATIGNGIHWQLQELLRNEGWQSEVEVQYDLKKFKLMGHIDLMKEKTIIELKTTSKAPETPYKNHLRQVNAYLIMAKAKKAYLIYIGRNGIIKVFNIKFDKKIWRETIKRAFHLWYCLQENRPPKPEFSGLCSFCEFKWRCYNQ